jgi:hypothetical protein
LALECWKGVLVTTVSPEASASRVKKEVVSRRWAEKKLKKKKTQERQAGNKRQSMLNENFPFQDISKARANLKGPCANRARTPDRRPAMGTL